jgi:hypothetical protein
VIRFGYALLATFLFSISCGCAGTETGNPPATDSAVAVGVYVPSTGFVSPSGFDANVLEGASERGVVHLSLARVELVPAGSCAGLLADEDAFVSGAIEVERPATGTFSSPPGSYCALRLWPTIAEDAVPVPEPLRGHALAMRLSNEDGTPYVTLQSDRTEPIVLFAEADSFTLTEGAATVTLLVDGPGALMAREFWMEPTEPDGSWLFDEAEDAAFLRLFESTPALFRLFLGSAEHGVPGLGDAGSVDAGVSGDALGPQLAATDPP